MPNLNEILSMLEDSAMSGIEKTASEKDEKAETEVPAGSEQFTKSASAIKEAEELGAKVAAQLLKQAEDEKKEAEGKEEKKDEGDDKEEGSDDKETKSEKEEENMDKKASLVDIISAMLEKSAFEGDENTQAGIPAGVVPNKAQVDSAAMVADQTAVNAPTPGTDGNSQGGTVNQILDAIVAKAQSGGAIGDNQVPGGEAYASAEMQDENVEKTAAVVALVESGIDFDSAVDLVKQAEEEIKMDSFEVEKQAAFEALIEAGVDFDQATDLVKEAAGKLGLLGKAKKALKGAASKIGNARDQARQAAGNFAQDAGNRMKGEAGDLKTSLRGVITGKYKRGDTVAIGGNGKPLEFGTYGKTHRVDRRVAANTLMKNPLAQAATIGAGGAAVAGGGYAAYQHQKKAAFDALVEDGVDFETAAELVKQASQELYGE